MQTLFLNTKTILALLLFALQVLFVSACSKGAIESAIDSYADASSPPQIIEVKARTNSSIQIKFDKKIEKSSAESASFLIQGLNNGDPLSVQGKDIANDVVILYTEGQSEELYALEIDGVQSLNLIQMPKTQVQFNGDGIPIIEQVREKNPNGPYGIGSDVDIEVVFNENVVVEGSPSILLNNGIVGNEAWAYYNSGSGTNTLTFRYQVNEEHSSGELEYSDSQSFVLNSGTIQDLNGNIADVTLPSPGGENSLSYNSDIQIDTVAPTASVTYSISVLTDQNVTATLVPSEPVTITNHSGTQYLFSSNGSFLFEFVDEAGNSGSSLATVSWIDKDAPIVKITSHQDLDNIAATTFNVFGTASDANLSSVNFYLDGVPQTVSGLGNWSVNLVGVTGGLHQLKVEATDGLGKISSQSINVNVDTSKDISLVNPVDGDVFISNSVTFNGTSSVGGGVTINSIELIINYDDADYIYTANNLSGDWTSWDYNASGLPWNKVISVKAKMTTDEPGVYYSNVVNISCENKLTFGDVISGVPADESFAPWVNYTGFTDPVIISAVKPGIGEAHFVDADTTEEDIESALPIIHLDSSNNRFEVKVINSGATARPHAEDVWYLMVEANTAANKHYTLSDGGELEAGNFTLEQANLAVDASNTWKTITFQKAFNSKPIVFVQQISDFNSGKFLVPRIQNVTNSQFQIAFQKDDDDSNPITFDETMSYVAIEIVDITPGVQPNNHKWGRAFFNGKLFQVGTIDNVANWTSGVNDIDLLDLYVNPISFLNLNTYNGNELGYARSHGISTTAVTTIHPYIEDTYTWTHVGETIVYFVIEAD